MQRVPESEAIAEMKAARQFNQVMGGKFIQEDYARLARDVVEMGVPPTGKVLDIGTGPGFVAIQVAQRLPESVRVTGLDLSAAMLAVAAENARRAGLNGRVSWREGNAKAMPFADGEFDFVVSSGSLHHWEDPLAVLNEIARVLKPGGRCIVRDSKRLYKLWPKAVAWAIGLLVPPDFRVHYWNSIRSSYTADELEDLVAQSKLEGARVEQSLLDVMIVKEG
ncbi:MAG: class I SAM-dependent methyltransferase [Anaerolineae bacterium]|nr:class I SAM-dependent methyltransferase [Anaerolineae bacterium]